MSTAWTSNLTVSLIQFQPGKRAPEPLSPLDIPNDEESYSDSELLNHWKPQSASARARVDTHSGPSQATSLLARKEPAEPKIDLVGRQAVSTQHRVSY